MAKFSDMLRKSIVLCSVLVFLYNDVVCVLLINLSLMLKVLDILCIQGYSL